MRTAICGGAASREIFFRRRTAVQQRKKQSEKRRRGKATGACSFDPPSSPKTRVRRSEMPDFDARVTAKVPRAASQPN